MAKKDLITAIDQATAALTSGTQGPDRGRKAEKVQKP